MKTATKKNVIPGSNVNMGKLAYKRLARAKAIIRDLLEILQAGVHGAECFFCGESLIGCDPLKLTTHHINCDHNDNRPENKAPAHEICRRRYNAKVILHNKQKAQAKMEFIAQ